MSPRELAELIRKHPAVRLLDVRTPAEFEGVHIAGAYIVPLDTLHEHAREIRATVAGRIVLVCQSGQRARRAEDALARAGLTDLQVLEGGVGAWIAADLPVRRGPRRISLERQVRIVAGALAEVGGLLAMCAHPAFGLVPAIIGSGLLFAGLTDTCGMAMLLGKIPFNRGAECDVAAGCERYRTAVLRLVRVALWAPYRPQNSDDRSEVLRYQAGADKLSDRLRSNGDGDCNRSES